MSKTENNNKLVELEEEKKFWIDPRSRNVFNLFVQGKTIELMAETLSMRPLTIQQIITNRFFIKKLESHVRGILFTNQVAKVIAASDIFSKLWDRVADNINDIPPEICLKELTKMFPQKKEGMIINPKNLNVFMQVMKGKRTVEGLGERLGELDDKLGDELSYEGLPDNDEAIYPELEEGEDEDGEQQRDPSVDPEEQNKD